MFFKTLVDSLITNSVSRTTRTTGSNVEDSILRINISAAFLPISRLVVGYTQDTVTLPGFHGWVFTGETSGWSNTQTLTIGESQTPMPSPAITPTPTPYQEPRQNEQTEAIIGVVIVAVVLGAALGLLIYLIKRK